MAVITRFAPSPTGFLHVGGARTALYSWLYARRMQGAFILRIEDTDQARSTAESVQTIFDSMSWLGLAHDQGPFYQTDRFKRYETVLQALLAAGKAYRCYCSRERLDALRETQLANKFKPRYDGCCRDLTQQRNAPHVVRFRNPQHGSVVFDDLIKGRIEVANEELDDLILARTDGTPTYNFTVVVDDSDMAVTHVIRGDDHVNNTPRQINILEALDRPIPVYAHVPMILGDDGKRLSKRHGAVSVMQYQTDGYLPEALLNYLVRLGWSHGDQELFSVDEMVALFDLSDVNHAPSTFSIDKLNWLNQQYIRTLPLPRLCTCVTPYLLGAGIDLSAGPALDKVLTVTRERVVTLVDFIEQVQYFYQDFDSFDAKASKKHLKASSVVALRTSAEKLAEVRDWSAAVLHPLLAVVATELDVGMGKVGMPLRVAITGKGTSPALDVTLALVGKTRSLARIQRAIEWIETQADG